MNFVLGRCLVFMIAAIVVACQGTPGELSSGEEAISPGKGAIFPPDNRKEQKELGSGDPRMAFAKASVALVPRLHIQQDANATVFGAMASQPTLEDAYGLCPGERYANQPGNLSTCSGTYVGGTDNNLVFTAGHCLGKNLAEAKRKCRTLAVVFDYALTGMNPNGDFSRFPQENVYICDEVLAFANEEDSSTTKYEDFAVMRLKRSVRGRTPVAIRRGPPLPVGANVV